MLLTAFAHALLGALCALRFKVLILIPLVAAVCIEIAFLKRTDTWSSAVRAGIALIISLEIGYFVGCVLRQLYRRSSNQSAPHKHNWLPLIAIASGLVFEFGRHL
jgi:uncharacterized protein YqgC (DUF456 family)